MDNDYDARSVASDPLRDIAVKRADQTRLLDALAQIEAFHANNRTGLSLNPPLDEAALDKALSGFPCEIPDEARTLWAWRNGESTGQFIWYHRFLPVEEAVREYRQLTSNPLYAWSKHWIPVFEFEGEWYAVECTPGETAGTPVIHYFMEDDPKQAYINLTAYMSVIAAAIQQGALRWDGQWWDDDIQRLSRIHARLNPDIGFPYHVPD